MIQDASCSLGIIVEKLVTVSNALRSKRRSVKGVCQYCRLYTRGAMHSKIIQNGSSLENRLACEWWHMTHTWAQCLEKPPSLKIENQFSDPINCFQAFQCSITWWAGENLQRWMKVKGQMWCKGVTLRLTTQQQNGYHQAWTQHSNTFGCNVFVDCLGFICQKRSYIIFNSRWPKQSNIVKLPEIANTSIAWQFAWDV